MESILITISEIVGALTVIITALVAIEKWSKGKISSWLLKPLLDEIKSLNDRVAKIELDNLKLIIMSNEIPLEERLQAGERYINLGGNGGVKVHVKILKEEYEDEIKKG